MVRTTFTSMLERLHAQSASDWIFLEESLTDFGPEADEATDYPHPIMDKAIEDSGPQGFRVLTYFSPHEFETIWSIIESSLSSRWNDGSGRKSTTEGCLLCYDGYLKHYLTWEKHALDFGMKAPTLEKVVMRVINTVQPVLYEHFVTMPKLRNKACLFRNYPYAKYATNEKLQPSNHPTGPFGEQKHYFSRKHKLYGLMIEASVSPEGLLVDMSAHEPGSVSDITMFRDDGLNSETLAFMTA
ncbi:hypothetical protein B5M09_011675 [Aphanomyces astaci]|uniref:DDE Tnp4 domain-containing protein n=1 Tax=Aphanomyces astaci TaxID=112090 RepID=A0A425DHK9_APHAT|nr:hypothetical protein B5M09_011675 [Aphanomyces astaci]